MGWFSVIDTLGQLSRVLTLNLREFAMRARCCLILIFAAASAASAATVPADCYLTRKCPDAEKIKEEIRPGVSTNQRRECRAEIPGQIVTRQHEKGGAKPAKPGTPGTYHTAEPCGTVWVDLNYGIRGPRNWVQEMAIIDVTLDPKPIPCGYLRLGSACQI